MRNATIKAEELANISSYQTLKTDNDFVVIIRTKEAVNKWSFTKDHSSSAVKLPIVQARVPNQKRPREWRVGLKILGGRLSR
jgi:hypothetical protein